MKSHWIILLLPLLLSKYAYSNDAIKVKAVPPIYKTEVKNVILYEATIPILFRVPLPKLRSDLPSGFDNLCTANLNQTGEKNGTRQINDDFYCALEKQFLRVSNHVIKDLQKERTFFRQYSGEGVFNNDTGTDMGRNRKPRQVAAVATVASSLLAGFLLRPAIGKLFGGNNNEEWPEHYNAIRDSLINEHKLLLDFQETTHTFAEEMTSILGNISAVITDQKRDLISSLRLLTAKMHTDFIQEAVRYCKANLLPENLIQPDFLKSTLTKLAKNITNVLNYSLAIDYNDKTGLAKYFTLPITDCMFYEDEAVIQLNLPLKGPSSIWKLFEVIHAKFSYNGQVCEVYPQEANYLAQEIHTNKTVLITRNMLKYCSVLEHHLCMIPRFGRESTQSLRCTGGDGHQTSLEELSKTCSFQCYTSDELIVTEVDEKTVIVTNSDNITYKCSGSEKKTIKTGKIGALEINLECECSIMINGNEELPKPFLCPILNNQTRKLARPSFSFTVPLLWTHNLSSLNTDFNIEIGNHTDLAQHINRHWSWMIPVLNFTKRIEEENAAVNFTMPEKVLASSHTGTMTLVGVWLALVTITVILHVIFTFYCFFKLAFARYRYDLVPQPEPHFRHTEGHECPNVIEDDICRVKRRQHKHEDSPGANHQGKDDSSPRTSEETDHESRTSSDTYRNNRNSIVNKLI